MKIETYPWEHLIIDNFYDEQLFANMKKEMSEFIREKKNNYTHDIRKQKRFLIMDTDINFPKILPETYKCLISRPVDASYLDFFSKVRDYISIKAESEINVCLDDLDYPIHDENIKKILSCVVYVMPEESRGTILYDKDKNFVKELEWKPNTMFIFPGLEGITWHSYKCIPGSYRITINTFLKDLNRR